ncbi:hypothetical protein [Porphyromonas gingivalis]|nr:hypothetical protein [Porphyromonas gingivalis]
MLRATTKKISRHLR